MDLEGGEVKPPAEAAGRTTRMKNFNRQQGVREVFMAEEMATQHMAAGVVTDGMAEEEVPMPVVAVDRVGVIRDVSGPLRAQPHHPVAMDMSRSHTL